MTTRRTFVTTLIALLLVPATMSFAQDSKSDALKKRFQARAEKIRELKSKGTIGETDTGYVEWVEKKDAKAADAVNDENSDRKALYALLAEKTKESPEIVAKHAAQRNFDRAKAGDYLQVEGKWHQKEG